MSLLELSLLTAACVNIGIGFYALYLRPRRITTYALVLFAVGLGIWVGSFFLLLFTHDFYFDKVNHYAGLLFIGGLFLLALTFPDKKFRAEYLIAYLPFVLGIIFVAHGGVVLSDTFGPGDSVTPTQGPLFPYYACGLITYMLISILLFIFTYRKLTGIERLRMKYLFLGIVVFVIPVCVCDIALPAVGFPYLNLIGPLASVGFVMATCYAVIRHQLMDIRVVIQRGTIYSLLISLIIATYLVLLLFIKNLFDANIGVADPLSAAIVILIGLATMPRIERYFQKVTAQFFFKYHYDYAVALEELSDILNVHIKLSELVPSLLMALARILQPTDIEFIHIATGTTFTLKSQQETFSESPSPIAKNGTRVTILARGRSIGLFTFGPKRSGDPYTEEDQRLLRTFASQAAVAFEKTELYERLEVYSRSLEEKVLERTKSLADLQKHQRELFDDVSHALQTPLTVLKSTFELLKANQARVEKLAIESAERSIDNLSRLIRGLLQLARIDALPEEESLTSVHISELISNVIEYVEIVCQEKAIRIVKYIQPNLLMFGDEKQIEEIITNLLSNAVNYTTDCPRRIITVNVAQNHAQITISIADTGIGIAEEQLPYIFDRFYRGQQTSAPGHGLGLAIVKRIVDRHHGIIRAESTLGVGTSFIVEFPVAPDSESLQ